MRGFRATFVVLIGSAALMIMTFAEGCSKVGGPSFSSEYQAIFLDNGQVFFAKLENASAEYPLLKEVFYVQSRMNPETKQPANVLVRRGSEWHGPDHMHVSAKHIVAIEPVAANSRVAQLIKEAKIQKPVQ